VGLLASLGNIRNVHTHVFALVIISHVDSKPKAGKAPSHKAF